MSLVTLKTNEPVTRVLAVDDSAADRNLVRLSLSGSPYCYKLEYAERLSEGLSKLERQKADVLLLDLNLPDSQGKETIEKVMRHAPHVPVLVLTGSDDDVLALEAVRLGAQDYIVKGQISSRALSRAMRYAIGRHNLLIASRQLRPRRSRFDDDVIQSPPELSSSLSSVPRDASLAVSSSTALLSQALGPEFDGCVMKSRQGYQGLVIEARVYERKAGGFSVEISIEDHDGSGVGEKKFYIPDSFEAPESAMDLALTIAQQKIDQGHWTRHGIAPN